MESVSEERNDNIIILKFELKFVTKSQPGNIIQHNKCYSGFVK